MVLRRRLGEARWCGKLDTIMSAERYNTVSEILTYREERGRDVWERRGWDASGCMRHDKADRADRADMGR